MPFDVKLLVAGNPTPTPGSIEVGDIVSMCSSASDWGLKTVAPSWIRLAITAVKTPRGFPNTQEGAEDFISAWLDGLNSAFSATEITGAIATEQRYRVALLPDVGIAIKPALITEIKQQLSSVTEGTVKREDAKSIDLDCKQIDPIELLESIKKIRYRRLACSSTFVASVLATSTSGQPAETTLDYDVARAILRDKVLT
jgi:hypothetical protein